MKVLWIKSDFPLPADTGGKIRTKNLLFELARQCQVTFLSYAPPDLEDKWFAEMKEAGIETVTVPRAEEEKQGLRFALRVLSRLFSTRPYVVNKYVSAEMTERISGLLRTGDFDVVVCDFLEMAWCAKLLSDVPAILFEHNVETIIWRRHYEVATNPLKKLYLAWEKRRMARFETSACQSFDLVLTVSDQDGELLSQQFGLKRYVTVPTGVDTDYFQPGGEERANHLVLTGSMDWLPNIDAFWWFYRSIYPLIRAEIPCVSLTVVGRRPPADIVEIGRLVESVEITGTVADVRPYVAAGSLVLVPLRVGGGTRIKIYEALAMKKCVVSTAIGAEGLPLEPDEHIVLADTAADFAKKVTELLRDQAKRHKIAETAYRLVTHKYSWTTAATVLQQGLQSVLAEKAREEQAKAPRLS